MELGFDRIVEVPECPDRLDQLEGRIRLTTEALIAFVRRDTGDMRLRKFEQALWPWIAQLFRLGVALFLAVRHERLDLQACRSAGWRVKRKFATRVIKTIGGPVKYGRAYLTRRNGGGWFPLDARLGITQDGFSWGVIDLVTRLATRVSYSAVQSIFKAMYGWAPSTEAIESLAIGLGSRAPAFMAASGVIEGDGEVLVIEVDGKAAPMATPAELQARRRKRDPTSQCSCGCQRHRGRSRRQGKQKKRKKRGHNSKNGRSATLIGMYTLRRGEDGRLHGPIHKKVWGQFGPRKAALRWARDQATRRGFGPDTSKRVQIVLDGEICLRRELNALFPNATFTLDLRHSQEYLWKAGRLFHAEASPELEQWVQPLNELLLAGRVDALVGRLREIQGSVPQRGPNTKRKRETLRKCIAYFEERREIMHYDEYRRDDLVLATGVIEGACRYVVKERLDCAGMRWTPTGAERVLQLRCIELNGDWDAFIAWVAEQTAHELEARRLVQLRPQKPDRASGSETSEKPTSCAA